MIRVILNVIGHASEFFPNRSPRLGVEIPHPMTVRDILGHIGVRPELVMRVASGGQTYSKDYVPADGEEITLISPPSGG